MSEPEKMQMTLGQKIRLMRELRGLKQETVATELDMTQGGYGKIERDETDVPFSRLTDIAKVLKVSVSDILNVDDNKIQYYLNNSNASFHSSCFNHYGAEKEVYEKLIATMEREITLLRQTIETLKNQGK
jgi:transcriptional regulator with XRE-family HTH domain